MFIAGWKQLKQLREPAKLRPWLCGITRNLINHWNRRRATEPSRTRDGVTAEFAGADLPPSELAIQREQEAILWQALRRVPERYRQPLVLYYREHRSVERVARDLDLSEEAVRQRLSRGRKLLQREVAQFVEGALERTAPGAMFTMSVIGALPLLAASGAAGAGTAAGVGTPWLGAGFASKLLTVFQVVIGPLIGLLAAWFAVRAEIADTHSPEERRLVKRYFLRLAGGTVVFSLLSIPLNAWAKANGSLSPAPMLLWLALLLAYLGGTIALAVRLQRIQRRLRRVESEPTLTREYRSRWILFGLPLVHVRLEARGDAALRPAVGWIAIGNYAVGLLFAWGGVAVGAVSGGGIAAGLLSIGAISLGGFAVGGLAIGGYAMGGVAVGFVATGAFAFGWLAAEGRYAIAREFALGVHASALHANDALARQFFADRPWMDLRTSAGQTVLSLVWLPALAVLWHVRRRHRRKRDAAAGAGGRR